MSFSPYVCKKCSAPMDLTIETNEEDFGRTDTVICRPCKRVVTITGFIAV